jgi:hypothetical protein
MRNLRHISRKYDDIEQNISIHVLKYKEQNRCLDSSLWQYGMGLFWLDFV